MLCATDGGLAARYPRAQVTERDIPLCTARRHSGSSRTRWLDRLPEGRFALVVAAPGLLLVGAVRRPPILAAVGMSFFRIELLRDDFTPFIGFRNYAVRLPADSDVPGDAAALARFRRPDLGARGADSPLRRPS